MYTFFLDRVGLGTIAEERYKLGCLWVEYFTLPVGDMNSPNYNKCFEGIDFFRHATQSFSRAL